MSSQELIDMLKLCAGPVIVELGRRGDLTVQLDQDAVREERTNDVLIVSVATRLF